MKTLLVREREANKAAGEWVEANGGFEDCLERLIRVAAEITDEATDERDGHHRREGWKQVVSHLRAAMSGAVRHGING